MSNEKIWLLLVGLLAFGTVHCDSKQKASEDESPSTSETADRESDSGEGSASNTADNQKESEPEVTPSELPYMATGPVAVVDGTDIPADVYNRAVYRSVSDGMARLHRQNPDRHKELALEHVIDAHLLDQQFDSAGIEVSDEDVSRAVERWKNDDYNYGLYFRMPDVDTPGFREQMRRELRLRRYLRQERDVEVTDQDARDKFESNPEAYRQQEQVKARHILLKVAADASDEQVKKVRKEAERLANKARKGDVAFAELAREHSEGPSKSKGGDLGYFPKGKMVQSFSEKAFSMEPGDVSDPVRSDFGFHVIKVDDHREARDPSFDDVKSEIVRKLEEKAFERELESYLGTLRENAEVEKNLDNLEVNVATSDQEGAK